jgi:hypothetical protein
MLPLSGIQNDSVYPNLVCRHAEIASLIALIADQVALRDPLAIDAGDFVDTSDTRNAVVRVRVS